MPYGPARDDTDGFVCDGEWVSRSRSSTEANRITEAMEEWQERMDGHEVAPVGKVSLDGLSHGGGKPPPGGVTWRYRRRG